MIENGKRARNGELAPISPRKRKDPVSPSHENIYREKRPSRPLSPNQQMTVMLAIEHDEDRVIGKPSEVDMEVGVNTESRYQSLQVCYREILYLKEENIAFSVIFVVSLVHVT